MYGITISYHTALYGDKFEENNQCFFNISFLSNLKYIFKTAFISYSVQGLNIISSVTLRCCDNQMSLTKLNTVYYDGRLIIETHSTNLNNLLYYVKYDI